MDKCWRALFCCLLELFNFYKHTHPLLLQKRSEHLFRGTIYLPGCFFGAVTYHIIHNVAAGSAPCQPPKCTLHKCSKLAAYIKIYITTRIKHIITSQHHSGKYKVQERVAAAAHFADHRSDDLQQCIKYIHVCHMLGLQIIITVSALAVKPRVIPL